MLSARLAVPLFVRKLQAAAKLSGIIAFRLRIHRNLRNWHRPKPHIEKKDYANAETLLNKVVAAQPGNYQAWFDLGFVYNALGRTEDSIAAYRKSVAAKPDVFESNLNLGLMLAKNKQPGAEDFLKAATRLKPLSHVEEGHARAWLSLGSLLDDTDPDQAMEAYRQASALMPKDPEPRLSAGMLLEKQSKFADAEEQYKQALTLDPSSQDAWSDWPMCTCAASVSRSRRISAQGGQPAPE